MTPVGDLKDEDIQTPPFTYGRLAFSDTFPNPRINRKKDQDSTFTTVFNLFDGK